MGGTNAGSHLNETLHASDTDDVEAPVSLSAAPRRGKSPPRGVWWPIGASPSRYPRCIISVQRGSSGRLGTCHTIFFDLTDNKTVHHFKGKQLRNLEAAHEHAIEIARELIRTKSSLLCEPLSAKDGKF